MALEDLLGKRNNLEEQIGQFLKGEGTEEEILKNSASARKTREEFLGEVSKTSPEVARFVGAKTAGRLETGLADIERQRAFEQRRKKLNMQFNFYLDLAKKSGMDLQKAINFAREKSLLDEELEHTGQIEERERESARRINELQNLYSRLGIDLERRFEPSSFDYTQALLGGLAGIGGTVAGTYLGKRFPKLGEKKKGEVI